MREWAPENEKGSPVQNCVLIGGDPALDDMRLVTAPLLEHGLKAEANAEMRWGVTATAAVCRDNLDLLGPGLVRCTPPVAPGAFGTTSVPAVCE